VLIVKVEADSVVELDFTASVLPEDEIVESTRGRGAIVVRLGRAELAPGIERALIGMDEGEEKSIDLGPESGYGPVRPEAIHRRSREEFPPDAQLKPGTRFAARLKDSTERVEFAVREVDEEEVVIDFNHPFAGRQLRYWLKVRSIREPTTEERDETRWVIEQRRKRMREEPPDASLAPASGETAGAAPSPDVTSPAAETTQQVSIEDVMRLGLRVGRVREAARVKRTDRLLELTVEVGTETRSLVAGIAAKYEPESLIGRSIIVVTNLKPAKIRGVESRGMLLAAVGEDGQPIIASFDEPVPSGSEVR
jgi:methionine--tRNA ligase beta chain